MPMRASRRSTRARRSPSPAWSPSTPGRTCRAGSTARRCTRTIWSIPTTPTCSTTSRASSASASPRWSARPRRRPRPACAPLEVDYEILPAVFDPVAAMEPGAPILHDKNEVVTDNGNIFCTLQGEIGDVAKGFKEADAVHEHDLLDLARAARPSRDARLDRLQGRGRPLARPHQLARARSRSARSSPT